MICRVKGFESSRECLISDIGSMESRLSIFVVMGSIGPGYLGARNHIWRLYIHRGMSAV